MSRLAECLISSYVLYALATLLHNLHLRFVDGSLVCSNIGCLLHVGETAVWAILWPAYWPMYLGWA